MPNTKESYTISFRVSGLSLSKLEKLAAEKKVSIHEQARKLVLDALDDDSTEEIKTNIKRTREDIEDFKLAVAVALEALLVKAGNVEKETAKDWITEQFRKR